MNETRAPRAALKAYVESRPAGFALLVTVAFFALGVPVALFPRDPVDGQPLPLVLLSYDAGRYLLAAGLLTALGWWRRAGFAERPRARLLLPFLPWVAIPLLVLLPVLSAGLGTNDPARMLLIVETCLAAGFAEEALYRGVVLRALEPGGRLRAAILSSALFGLLHVMNLLSGADPLYTGLQIVWAFLVGFSLAAPVLATGWIWPAVVLHFAVNVIGMLGSGRIVQTERPDAAATAGLLVLIGLFALLAAFGWWVLRRHDRAAGAGVNRTRQAPAAVRSKT